MPKNGNTESFLLEKSIFFRKTAHFLQFWQKNLVFRVPESSGSQFCSSIVVLKAVFSICKLKYMWQYYIYAQLSQASIIRWGYKVLRSLRLWGYKAMQHLRVQSTEYRVQLPCRMQVSMQASVWLRLLGLKVSRLWGLCSVQASGRIKPSCLLVY